MLLNNRQFGLGALPVLGDFESRSISAENPDGSRAGGAKASPVPFSTANGATTSMIRC